MAKNDLFKDLTNYNPYSVAGQLPYTSDRSIANYKKMRMHPMCALGLNFTTLGLPNIPYTVQCDDADIRAIVDKMLARIWKRLIRDAFESLVYGYKPFEIRYEPGILKYKVDDDSEEKTFSGVLLKQPRALDPEYVRILIQEDGSLRGFQQDFATQEVLVDSMKCLLVVNNFESGNYYGISALEPVYSPWYISAINMQFHTRWLERKGTGLFKGRYPVGVTETGKDNSAVLQEILDSIMEGTTLSLPAGVDDNGNYLWDVTILDADDKTDAFIQFHEYLDKMILRGLVIPERALTQGEIGARSSVEAFTDVFMQRKQDILDNIVDYINKYLVQNFVKINWGTDVDVMVTSGKIGDESRQNAYTIIEKLVDKSAVDIDLAWLIEKTGIPILEKEMIKQEFDADAKNSVASSDDAISEKKIEEEKESLSEQSCNCNKKHEANFLSDDRWAGMTTREKKYQLDALSSWLSTRSNQFQSDLRAELIFQKDRIKSFLQKNIAGSAPWDVADGIEIKAAPIRLLYKIFLNDVYTHCYSTLEQSSSNRMLYSEESAFIKFKTSMSAENLISQILTAAKQSVQDAIARQQGIADVIESFSIAFDSFLGQRIATIAETELSNVMSIANTIHQKTTNKLVEKGVLPAGKKIERVQFSAIMDADVCDLCAKLGTMGENGRGLIVNVDSPIRAKYNTPLHYLCRCVWLPISADEISDPRVLDTNLSIDPVTKKPFMSDTLTAQLGSLLQYKTFK